VGERDEVLAEYGSRSYSGANQVNPVVFPLVHQGESFGELRLGPRRPDEAFSLEELSLLRTVAQQVSVAAYAVQWTLD
jgi:GAF domain-containing protein